MFCLTMVFYTIPSKVEDDQDDEDDEDEEDIFSIKLSIFDENTPVMFSNQIRSRKLGKSARSRIDTEEQPPAKKKNLNMKRIQIIEEV